MVKSFTYIEGLVICDNINDKDNDDNDDDDDPIEFVYPLCVGESIFHCQSTFTTSSKPLPNNNTTHIHLSTWSK